MDMTGSLVASILSPLFQTPEGTNQFFTWFFYGLGGIGGWLIFLLLALAGVIWLFYDSLKRKIPAYGWKTGVVLLALLLLPTILFRFTVTPIDYEIYQILQLYPEDCPLDVIHTSFPDIAFTDCDQLQRSLPPMTPYGEIVFYLGLLGGILAPILAVGYYITYQGMVGCNQGHVYEKTLERIPGQCPHCNPVKPPPPPPPPGNNKVMRPPEPKPLPPERPKISYAWLVDPKNNRQYALFEGKTRIGRGEENDLLFTDKSISHNHAQIKESHGHLTITDLDSSYGTYVNGDRVQSLVLQSGDEITIGNTVLKFVSTR